MKRTNILGVAAAAAAAALYLAGTAAPAVATLPEDVHHTIILELTEAAFTCSTAGTGGQFRFCRQLRARLVEAQDKHVKYHSTG
jgi:hypothetical protein